MSEVSTWSTTAASNNSTPPDGFPEGMFPSTVNNSSREMMAAVARLCDRMGVRFLNLGFDATVASDDLTVALKTASAADPASTDPVTVFFRNTTLTTGQRVAVDFSAATSVVLPGGGSLGFANSETGQAFIYAIYDGTNKDIGIARLPNFDEGSLHSTTTIGTGSDAVNVIYTTTGRTNASVVLIGRITIQYGTAAWTNSPTNKTVWLSGMSREITGSYTGTLTGLSTSPTVTINFSIMGDIVTLTTGVSVTGTSNANTFTVTGAPILVRPNSVAGFGAVILVDNGAASSGAVRMESSGTLTFTNGASTTGFTGSGTKGFAATPVTYTYKLTNP